MFKYWGSNRQLETEEAVWKPMYYVKTMYYVKQRSLLAQVAGSPTNISQLQKPKHQSEYIQKLS